MTQRYARLGLERLDSRILPSASPLAPVAHAATFAPAILTPHTLAGAGHGDYSYDAIQSGAGIEYRLTGKATLADTGHVSVTGSVHAVGFIQTGRATGEITFTNANGSVTVDLEGPPQSAFSPLPKKFSYHVVDATGKYAGLSDSGTLSLTLKPEKTAPGMDPHGTFAFTLSPSLFPPHATTGIKGVALVGPTSPVARPGVPDTRPLPGAVITVQPEGGGAEIARTVADAKGRFELDLPPGHYRLVALAPQPGALFPRGSSMDVVVDAKGFTPVVVNYDSGIR